jgi:hypothetical protein
LARGEGAQAYGWGRYDAGAEDVAAKYRKDLSNDVFVEKDGRVFDPSTLEHLNLKAGLRKHNGDINALMADPKIQNIIKENGVPDVLSGRYSQTEYQQMFSRDMAVLSDLQSRGGLTKGEGYLYKHDLPDEDIARYMDWDKPLSEQPESVRAAVAKLQGREPDGIQKITDETMGRDIESIARWITDDPNVLPSDKLAAENLGRAGIPGLKYLDGTSRYADGGADAKGTAMRILDAAGGDYDKAVEIAKARRAVGNMDPNDPRSNLSQAIDMLENKFDDGRTRNYVTWDQDVLDRMKLLERNGEDMRQALMYGQGGL